MRLRNGTLLKIVPYKPCLEVSLQHAGVHYWVAIRVRRVLQADSRLARSARCYRLDERTGKVVLPWWDAGLWLHFGLVGVSVGLHANAVATGSFLLHLLIVLVYIGMAAIFKRLESAILVAQFNRLEKFQFHAIKVWMSSSLIQLGLFAWIVIDEPANGFQGTWRQPYLIAISTELLLLTVFKEWTLDSKLLDVTDMHPEQLVGLVLASVAVSISAAQLAIVIYFVSAK
eukprot:SAG11_NODE_801_length_7112_cov_6.438329_6_plen_229_part_00